jgi:YD repeat-containing protein
MNKFLTSVLIILLFTKVQVVNAQIPVPGQMTFESSAELMGQIKFPKSPEAAAFEKYGNTSVNLHTGTPNITVPIHTVKGRELDLPIYLTYDASGVKVDEVATNIGLKWNLNFGGRITRNINGGPDNGYFNPSLYSEDLDFIETMFSQGLYFYDESEIDGYYGILKNISDGCEDLLTDLYSVNAPGLNETVGFDIYDLLTPYPLVNPRVTIQRIDEDLWIVTNEDGTKYYFGYGGATETTTIEGSDDVQSNHCPVNPMNSTTSWLLTKIVSKNGMDIYDFTYQLFSWQDHTMPMQTVSSISNSIDVNSLSFANYYWGTSSYNYNFSGEYAVNQQMPVNVIHNGKLVANFVYKNRDDLKFIGSNGNALDKINFYKFNTDPIPFPASNKIYKQAKFTHGYFGDVETTGNDAHLNKRLMLKDVTISDGNTTITEDNSQTYSFEYFDEEDVPKVGSYSQDFLGLYNGRGNSTLVPEYIDNVNDDDLTGAKRDFRLEYAVKGTLKKIIYPTKGFSQFDYEQHTTKPLSPYSITTKVFVGGEAASPIDLGTCDCVLTDYVHHYMDLPYLGVSSHIITIPTSGNYFVETTSAANLVYMISRPICLDDAPDDYNRNVPSAAQRTDPINLNVPFCTGDNLVEVDTALMYALSSGCYPSNALYYGYTQTQPRQIFLTAGQYQLTAWCGEDPTGFSIYRYDTTWPYNIDAQGFRIASITDYTQESVIASRKSYKYVDNLDSPISSGYAIANPPSYQWYTTTALDNQEAERDVFHITRTTQGFDYTPNVGYDHVFEITDFGEGQPHSGFIKHSFEKADKSGIYDDRGVKLFKNPDVGKEISTKIYDSNSTLTKQIDSFYENPAFFGIDGGLSARVSFAHANETWGRYKPNSSNSFIEVRMPPEKQGIPGSSILGLDACFWIHPATCFADFDDAHYTYNSQLGSHSFSIIDSFFEGSLKRLIRKETSTYYSTTDIVKEIETYKYQGGYPFLLAETVKSTASGITTVMPYALLNGIKTTYEYDDVLHEGNPEKIIRTQTYRLANTTLTLLTTHENIYSDAGSGNFLTEILVAKGSNPSESRLKIEYNQTTMNPMYSMIVTDSNNSLFESYLYGYNNTLPVAKLTGVPYDQIPTQTISNIMTYANGSDPVGNETQLHTSLFSLYTIPESKVTLFTYDPVKGMTRQTDQKGITTYYEYDELGRLKTVKDNELNKISENQYHYKAE